MIEKMETTFRPIYKVYRLIWPLGIYIGSTGQTMKKRLQNHRNSGSLPTSATPYFSLDRNPEVEIVSYWLTRYDAAVAENKEMAKVPRGMLINERRAVAPISERHPGSWQEKTV